MAYIFANQLLDMFNPSLWRGEVVEVTSTKIVISDGYYTGIFEGYDFQFDGYSITGGVLERYEEYFLDSWLGHADDLKIYAPAVSNLILSNDLPMLYSLALVGNDTILGSGDNDVLMGYAGNDQFVDAGGYNVVNGGSGLDVLDVYGNFDNFSVIFAGGEIWVDRLDRAQENTTVSIERIVFDDGTLALDYDGNAGQAYRIYQAAFDRTPDTAGVAFWVNEIDNGMSLLQVASGFLQSAEFLSIYGTNPSNLDFIERLYQNVLGREGEAAGVDYWLDQMQQGADRAQVLASFSESQENVVGVMPQIENGIWLG